MTNEEKYKTDEERTAAFDKFCCAHQYCHNCSCNRTTKCAYVWLTLEVKEAEEEQAKEEMVLNNEEKRNELQDSWTKE